MFVKVEVSAVAKWQEELEEFFETPQDNEEVFIEFRTFKHGVDGGYLSKSEFIEMCLLVSKHFPQK